MKNIDLKELVGHFEKNWGRLLSPLEIEKISELHSEEGYAIDLIYEALKIAVVNRKLFLGYVTGILRRMNSQGIQTVMELNQAKEIKQRQQIPTFSDDEMDDMREAMIAAELMWSDGSDESKAEIDRLKKMMKRPCRLGLER